MEGNMITYNAKLIIKGYYQRQEIDYDETFSPVVMLKSIMILLAITAHYDYETWKMDVKTTFLNGNLSKEVYMTQPKGFIYEGFIYYQRQEIDYDETFSPVVMLKSIRILLAITAYYDYETWKMDVKTTFLNGNLSKEVYMTQPKGFIYENGNKV